MNAIVEKSELAAAQKAQAALNALNEAWAYYTPQPKPVVAEADPVQEPFQYHNAA